ncbi:Uu.00g088510.m01.CDS01 [Anthostomella pinea]|uniref:Uu.00g088510.m01.CDS01 n=1 Tax=Anthostomella pinea TaxID=933095 RepID=A0AAI8YK31_9PEZI|nr:Uu.00g088510.m01.CDS01 [Anthostomella pinea]
MAAQDPLAPTDSNGAGLVITAAVMLSVAWLSVFLRSYVRAVLTQAFLWDDWLMLAAQSEQVNFTVSCAFIFSGVRYGVGRHNLSLSQFDETQALKYQALATATYVLNMWLIKLSIGIFLLRFAVHKRYRYTLYISIVVVGIWSLVLFFWNIFQCNPVPAQWDYTILETDSSAHCASVDDVIHAAYALSTMTILSDWLYALLPIPLIWSLKMTAQAKLTVILILGLGIFASIATLVAVFFFFFFFFRVAPRSAGSCSSAPHLIYEIVTVDVNALIHAVAGTDAMIWTLVEPGVAIAAASLVTIRPLLRRLKVKGFVSTEKTSRTGPFSRNNRSSRAGRRSSKMPGFGSEDRTMQFDMELGHTERDRPQSTDPMTWTDNNSAQSKEAARGEEQNTEGDSATHLDRGSRRIEIRRGEAFTVDGLASPPPVQGGAHNGLRGAWFEQDSPNSSSVELETMASPVDDEGSSPTGLTPPYRQAYQR